MNAMTSQRGLRGQSPFVHTHTHKVKNEDSEVTGQKDQQDTNSGMEATGVATELSCDVDEGRCGVAEGGGTAVEV